MSELQDKSDEDIGALSLAQALQDMYPQVARANVAAGICLSIAIGELEKTAAGFSAKKLQ